MTTIVTLPSARIPIGHATVNQNKVDVIIDIEWMRAFMDLVRRTGGTVAPDVNDLLALINRQVMRAGEDGQDGADGIPGARGNAGATGASGFNGFDGEDGIDGFSMPMGNKIVLSGVYTPTLTNVANLDASTAYECQYLRVDNTVTVSGRVDVDPTLTATSTQLGISLPVASNIGTTQDVGGCAFASAIVSQGAAILGDAANDRAQMQWISGDITNQAMYFNFTFQVI